MDHCIMFAGQGAQTINELLSIYSKIETSKKVFKEISDIVSIPICKIIEEDLEKEIYKPHISSLLIFGFNLILLRQIQEIINPRFVIGYSIGQYSALHFSRSIDFESTVSLVNQRGRLLESITNTKTCLIGIIGLDSSKIKELINQEKNIFITSYSSPTNHTIACKQIHSKKIINKLNKLGALKCTIVKTSGAWHSPFVNRIVNDFETVIDKFTFSNPIFEFIDNSSAKSLNNNKDIKRGLVTHLNSPIKWFQTIEKVKQNNVTKFIEIGLGNHLSQFVKFSDRKLSTFTTTPFINATHLNSKIKDWCKS